MASADFSDSVDVKSKAEFVGAMMSEFRKLKPNSDSFVSYDRRDAITLSEKLSIGTENKIPVLYVEVFREISKDHGTRGNDLFYLAEFPIKSRVEKPVLTYRLDATKLSELAKWPSSISMISKCVREPGTKKVTWAGSYLRIAFRNEEDLEDYLKSLSNLLFDEKDKKVDGFVGLTKHPF